MPPVRFTVLKADDWLLAMVMDAQAQTNRIGDLIEKENRAMTLWMVELEKCLVGAPSVSWKLNQPGCPATFLSMRRASSCNPLPLQPPADEYRWLCRKIRRCGQ